MDLSKEYEELVNERKKEYEKLLIEQQKATIKRNQGFLQEHNEKRIKWIKEAVIRFKNGYFVLDADECELYPVKIKEEVHEYDLDRFEFWRGEGYVNYMIVNEDVNESEYVQYNLDNYESCDIDCDLLYDVLEKHSYNLELEYVYLDEYDAWILCSRS